MTRSALAFLPFVLVAACASASDPSRDLSGTQWTMTSIDGAPAASPRASLAFAGDRVSASTGCNTMGGTWQIKDGKLIAGQLMQTEMACMDGSMEQEPLLAALLAAPSTPTIASDRLALTGPDHHAEFQRKP